MKSLILRLVLSGGAAVVPIAACGCDREVSHHETTATKSNGTQVHEETTVKQKSDGTVVKEQEKSVNKPANPNP